MPWDQDHLEPVEDLWFCSQRVKVGSFRCPPKHPCFRRTAPLDNDVFAFARRSLWLRRGHGDYRFIEGGAIVLHRAGSELERRAAAVEGDHAIWFGLHPDLFVEGLDREGLSTRAAAEPLTPDPRLRYRLTLLINALEREPVETLSVEESVLNLFSEICQRRAGHRPSVAGRPQTRARRRRVADRARAFLDAHLTQPMALDAVARAAGASPFHLCRLFREQTGMTMNTYRTRQRLGRAVERIASDKVDNLSQLAFELGFSSHSHLSREFRRHLGVPPSRLR